MAHLTAVSGRKDQGTRESESSNISLDSPGAREVQIQELSEDDMAYDGDVEVIKPDQYEEAESETDDGEDGMSQYSDPPEEQLAIRLRKLYCDEHQKETHQPARESRGRKRTSKEMQTDPPKDLSQNRPAELEITELMDELESGPPTKRRHGRTLRKDATNRDRSRFYIPIYHESSNSVIESPADSPMSGTAGGDDPMSIG